MCKIHFEFYTACNIDDFRQTDNFVYVYWRWLEASLLRLVEQLSCYYKLTRLVPDLTLNLQFTEHKSTKSIVTFFVYVRNQATLIGK